MKKIIFLIFVIFSGSTMSNTCNNLIDALKKRDMKKAMVELLNNCSGKIEVQDEFGDSKDVEISRDMANLIRLYPDCNDAATGNSYYKLEECLKDSEIESSGLKVDKYFNTGFGKEFQNWQTKIAENHRLKKERDKNDQFEKEAIAAKEKELNDKNKKESFENGSDLLNQACSFDFLIRKNQKFINNENEVGKVSGFYNKEKLYKLGTELVTFRKLLNNTKMKYSKRMKKAISLSSCTDPFNLSDL